MNDFSTRWMENIKFIEDHQNHRKLAGKCKKDRNARIPAKKRGNGTNNYKKLRKLKKISKNAKRTKFCKNRAKLSKMHQKVKKCEQIANKWHNFMQNL